MAGVIDDLESSLNAILRAKDIPVSIVIVKVGAQDEQDSNTLMKKASEVLSTCERSFVSLTELEKFNKGEQVFATNQFAYDVVKNLPTEVERFFELSRFDLDIAQNILESPTHTIMTTSESEESPQNSQHKKSPESEAEATRSGTGSLVSSQLESVEKQQTDDELYRARLQSVDLQIEI